MTKAQIETLGKKAMLIIEDYPLYAHTSGISYEEAIAIAKVFVPVSGWDDYLTNDGEHA